MIAPDGTPLCELCDKPLWPPPNRSDWKRCITCTGMPRHARIARYGPAPGYRMPAATADEVTFIVPGPPLSVNRVHALGYDRKTGRRHMYYTTQGRAFQSSIRAHAESAIRDVKWDKTRRYELTLISYFDNPRADSDGPMKVVKDALQCIRVNRKVIPGTGILYIDDCQVVSDHSEKQMDKVAPRMVVTVRAVKG